MTRLCCGHRRRCLIGFARIPLQGLTLSVLCLGLALFLPYPAFAQTPHPAYNPQAQAHRDKALGRGHQNDFNGAISEFQAAYALDKASHLNDAASDLESMGICYLALSQSDKAIPYIQKALVIFRQVKDTEGEGGALNDLGDANLALNQYANAIADYQMALPLYQQDRDQGRKAEMLGNLAFAYDALHQDDKAIPTMLQALTLFQQTKDVAGQAQMLGNLGNVYIQLGQYPKAIDILQQALPLNRQIKDTKGEAKTLNNLGIASENLSRYDAALQYDQQALVLYQQLQDSDSQAAALTNIGSTYDDLSQYDTAMTYYQKALPLFQKAADHQGEASDLLNLGTACLDLSQYAKAVQFFQAALPLFQQIKDLDGQARTINNLGNADEDRGQYDKALSYFQQALPLFQQIKDKDGEAKVLNNLGSVYKTLSQNEKAIPYFQQALVIDQQIENTNGTAYLLMNLGVAYDDLSQYDKAVSYLQQALLLFQQVKDKSGEASLFTHLGRTYLNLSQPTQAGDSYQQALHIYQEIKDAHGEADVLMELGMSSDDLGQYDKAVSYFQQALTVFQQVKDRNREANALNNLGLAYIRLAQYDKANDVLQKAIPIYEEVKDIHGEAALLANVGTADEALGQYTQALAVFQLALPIYQQVKDRTGEANVLTGLLTVWEDRARPRLAIFYGKQAVNIYQSIRQDIQKMDSDTQKTYLKAKEPVYRALAELLIAQGRLPEAEQVLNMLKNQEFFDFVQRDAATAPAAGETSLTPVEATWQTRYQVISDKITAIGQTKSDLLTRQQKADAGEITLTAPEKDDLQKSLTQADADLTVANKAFQDFLTQLATEFQNAPKSDQDKVQTVTDATAFEDTLAQLGPGTVALYTIVEPDKVRIVMVTSQTQVARQYTIKETDLRAKVLVFRQVLQDPTRDPRPLAHELYSILVGPIEQDLIGAKAITLMWSLDDVLRYLPMAALYDGKQYLVERYKNEVFTPASESRLTETPKAQWNGLGLGVSKEHPGFQALTGVPQELDDVIHDPSVSASQTGALPGTILLDTAFTQQAMTQALEARKYPLVHIASHFDFQPGDETASFLLLGDGNHLSLADIKTLPQVFQGVDLLTLSACDTADGSTGADGREVEGFAVLAQRLGAKAVIASLWPVADASTPLLMETFYRQHAAVPGQPKAEALRQAQLALLHGSISAPPTTTQRAEIVPDKSGKSASDAPLFTMDPKAPFAHPYYWAPFILIGNWK